MKIRTILTLGIGYAIGAKLGPKEIEAALRSVVAGQVPVPTDPADGEWPDSSFRL